MVEPKAEQEERAGKRPAPAADDDDDDGFEDDGGDDVLPEAQPSHGRNDVDKAASFRRNAVHVYGLDFLKTEHLNEIFNQFNHKFIEWINDSAANIIFQKEADAKRALDALSFPKVGDEPWRRTPDILVSDSMPPIFLQMRFSAASDAKRAKKGVPSIPKKTRRGDRMPAGPGQTKRHKPPPTPEERVQRQKRATRFADWMGSVSVDAARTDETQDKASERKPSEDKPSLDKPSKDTPSKDKPSEDKPSDEGDTAAEERAKKAARLARFAEKPVAEKPAAEKPVVEEPVAEKPAA